MPEPTIEELAAKRDQLVDGHLDTYASTLALMSEVGGSAWDQPSGCPGWSVKGVFSHMIGLEKVMLGDPFPDLRIDPWPEHVTDEFGAFTEVDVVLRKDRTPVQLLAEGRDVFDRRRASLDAMAPEDIGAQITGLTGTDVAARVLGTRLFDLWAHEQDIRRAVGRPGHLQGPAPDHFFKRAGRGLHRVLPGRVDGAGEVTITIEQPEERVLTADLGGGATVGLTLDLSSFVAFACGRSDAPPEAVRLDGDEVLAERVLDNLGLTP